MRLDAVELGDQFEWVDEFTWDAVTQEQERSLTGALLVQEGTKLHGRPITLRSGEGYGRRCGSCANWRCCATSACGSCRWCYQTAANSR